MRTKVNLALALVISLVQAILLVLISGKNKEGAYLFAKIMLGLNPLLLGLARTVKEEKFKRRTEINYEENIDNYFKLKRISTFKNNLKSGKKLGSSALTTEEKTYGKLGLPPIAKNKV